MAHAGLKNWHIGLIVLFVLLTIVGIIIALILYANHHKRCCFDPEKPVIPAFVARQSGDIPPPDLKAPHFDVVLIYSTENEKLAKWVKQQLATIKVEDKKRSIAVCVPDDLDFVQSKMDMCGEAIKRSTYIFLLMTKEFVEDKEALLHKDETLIESLENEDKRWCLVPLHTLSKSQRNKSESEEGFVYPYGLRSLVGVDISEIIQDQGGKGKRENKEKIDEVLDKITKLVEQRQNYKHDREKVQADELEKWKKERKAEKDLESANQKTGTGDKAVTMEQNEINEMKDLKNSKEKAVTNDEVSPLLPGAGDAATYIDVRQPTQNPVQPGSDVPVQDVQPNPPQQAQTPESDDGLGVSYKLDEVVADSQGDMTRI